MSSEAWGRLVSLNPQYPSLLLEGEKIVCGRANRSLNLTNASISAKHFIIERTLIEQVSIVSITDTSTNGTFLDGIPMKMKKMILTTQTDISMLNPKSNPNAVTYIYEEINPEAEEEKLKGPSSKYFVGKVIGSGSYGKVRLAVDKETNEVYALKVIEKATVFTSSERLNVVMDEVKILQQIDHPNIIKFKELFETSKNLYLVIEYADGGELYERVCYAPLSEERAIEIIRQCADALSYLHAKNIAHRDIKPENILLKDKESDVVKISDFGLSRLTVGSSVMKTKCGSPDYVAPEIIENDGSYSFAVDMWSLGIVTFVTLLSHFPEGLPHIDFGEKKDSLSPECKDFISRLIVSDPTKRMTAKEALEHPWIKGTKIDQIDDQTSTPIDNSHVETDEEDFVAPKHPTVLSTEEAMERFYQIHGQPPTLENEEPMPSVIGSSDVDMVSVYKRGRDIDEMTDTKRTRL